MSVKALCLISLSCILYQGERENIIPWNNVLKKEKKERYYWLEWSLRFTESFWKGRKAFLMLLPCIIDKEKNLLM